MTTKSMAINLGSLPESSGEAFAPLTAVLSVANPLDASRDPAYYQDPTALHIKDESGKYQLTLPGGSVFAHSPEEGLTYHFGVCEDGHFDIDCRPTEYDPKHEPAENCLSADIPVPVAKEALHDLLDGNRIALAARQYLIARVVGLIPVEEFGHGPDWTPRLVFPWPVRSLDVLTPRSKAVITNYLTGLRREVGYTQLNRPGHVSYGVPQHLTGPYQKKYGPAHPRAVLTPDTPVPYLLASLNLHTPFGCPPDTNSRMLPKT